MKKSEQHKNIAFVDGQNLHMGTAKMKSDPWNIDLKRFRRYLDEKLEVKEAYYFLGCLDEEYGDIYTNLQKAGFVLVFREHSNSMVGKKKGNVDVDIVFEVMKMLCNQEKFDKVVLVSGDGDYKKMVDFLIEKNKFFKIMFPNRKFRSSLYKKLSNHYFTFLDDKDVKRKIERKKKRVP